MKLQNRDYKDKKVFIGIDVHRKKYVIAASCEQLIVKKWTMEADPQSLKSQLFRFFRGAEIISGYEAGFSGFGLHRVLCSSGIKNIVVNPASIEVESNNRVKTDKRDAKKIAQQLESGRLRCIYIPSIEEEARRSLSRGREKVVRRRQAIGNQIKGKLHYLGIRIPDNKRVSLVFLRWVESLDFAAEHKFAFKEMIDAWKSESDRIKRFDQALFSQAQKDNCEEIYRSAPGIGSVSSRILSNELGDLSRFHNERQAFSCTGLTPGEHSSGEHTRRGHISRQGSPRIRCLLVEIAWRAITEDQSLKLFYEKVKKNRDSKKAIVAVARKMIGRLRKCFKENTKWKDLCLSAKAA